MNQISNHCLSELMLEFSFFFNLKHMLFVIVRNYRPKSLAPYSLFSTLTMNTFHSSLALKCGWHGITSYMPRSRTREREWERISNGSSPSPKLHTPPSSSIIDSCARKTPALELQFSESERAAAQRKKTRSEISVPNLLEYAAVQ